MAHLLGYDISDTYLNKTPFTCKPRCAQPNCWSLVKNNELFNWLVVEKTL